MRIDRDEPSGRTIEELLVSWSEGDPEALAALAPLVYDELRRTAQFYFSRESAGHTLQPTALVHELFLRLSGWRKVDWKHRGQFFAFAGTLMRRILIDHARARRSGKRGGSMERVELDTLHGAHTPGGVDIETLLSLDGALNKLEEIDPRQCRVVELTFFLGLTTSEISDVLDISPASVKRDWLSAKLWLARELGRKRDEQPRRIKGLA